MSPPENFRPALLIVDMQNDFCPPDGSLAVTGGRDIISFINELIKCPSFVVRIATKDFHPEDHISFASNHPAPNNRPFTSFARVVNPNNPEESYNTRLWPIHCVQGTRGADLVDNMDQVDVVIEKGMDKRVEMYSVFFDPFKISVSEATKVLRDQDITWVYVVGLAYDYCVKNSALDAKAEGFNVVVVKDGTRAVNNSEENLTATEEELGKAGIKVVDRDSEEIKWLLA